MQTLLDLPEIPLIPVMGQVDDRAALQAVGRTSRRHGGGMTHLRSGDLITTGTPAGDDAPAGAGAMEPETD